MSPVDVRSDVDSLPFEGVRPALRQRAPRPSIGRLLLGYLLAPLVVPIGFALASALTTTREDDAAYILVLIPTYAIGVPLGIFILSTLRESGYTGWLSSALAFAVPLVAVLAGPAILSALFSLQGQGYMTAVVASTLSAAAGAVVGVLFKAIARI